jgi:hypothetical protein
MVTTNKVVRSTLDKLPDLRALQMVDIIVVRSAQISAHGAVVPSNNDTTAAGLLLLVHAVFDPQTSLLDCIVEDSGVLVITNATKEDSGVGRKHILSATSGVLCSSAGDKLRGIVIQEVFVDVQVLLFRKDGIIGLEAILGEERFIALRLDIYGNERQFGRRIELTSERRGKSLTIGFAVGVRKPNCWATIIAEQSRV